MSNHRSTPSSHGNTSVSRQLAGIRVLLVENDGDQLAGLAGLLEEAGAEIDTAKWSEDAIVLLS